MRCLVLNEPNDNTGNDENFLRMVLSKAFVQPRYRKDTGITNAWANFISLKTRHNALFSDCIPPIVFKSCLINFYGFLRIADLLVYIQLTCSFLVSQCFWMIFWVLINQFIWALLCYFLRDTWSLYSIIQNTVLTKINKCKVYDHPD